MGFEKRKKNANQKKVTLKVGIQKKKKKMLWKRFRWEDEKTSYRFREIFANHISSNGLKA